MKTKAVLALYSFLVLASPCLASGKVELGFKKFIMTQPHPCACYHIIEAAQWSDWLGVAGYGEINLVEVCNNKYDITTMIVWNPYREVYDVEVTSAPLCPMFRWDTQYYISRIPKYWEYSVWAE